LGFNVSFGLDESHLISSAANIAGCPTDLKCQLGMNSIAGAAACNAGRTWIIMALIVHLTASKEQFVRGVRVELHQIRYLLALAKSLNFTRAAEECNVSQPALSRAISQLEAELGGELFRRERNLTHVTDLGQSVLPALRQCYEASHLAKSLAREFLKEGHAPLVIALSRAIEIEFLSPVLIEVAAAFPKIEIKISRGHPQEIADKLRNGEVEIAIAGSIADDWERLESNMLYQQRFGLLLNREHRLARQNEVQVLDLREERLICRPHCALTAMLLERLKELGVPDMVKHEVPQIDDIPDLVQANFGVGIWPAARKLSGNLTVTHLQDVEMIRWIQVYTVFGRKHSAAAKTLAGLLRAKDWSVFRPDGYASREAVQ
jgi:DNA-binding transcriptional LysR family regulator